MLRIWSGEREYRAVMDILPSRVVFEYRGCRAASGNCAAGRNARNRFVLS
jgi:hypothetical protein